MRDRRWARGGTDREALRSQVSSAGTRIVRLFVGRSGGNLAPKKQSATLKKRADYRENPQRTTITDAVDSTASLLFGFFVKPALVATAGVLARVLPINAVEAALTRSRPRGTTPNKFAISPALPAGMSVAAGTGSITGTPTALSPVTTHTVTATDSDELPRVSRLRSGSRRRLLSSRWARRAGRSSRSIKISRSPSVATDATSYQWLRNGRPLVGTSTTSYAITAARPLRDNGWSQLVAANAHGSTTSATMFVNVSISHLHE